MKKPKSKLLKVFLAFCRILMPEKYFDDIYIPKLLVSKNLKGLGLRKKIWCFIHGFLPYEYVWYNLPANDHKNYVPARNSYKKRVLDRVFNSILGNKILFEKHIKSVIEGIDKLHVVESIGYIERGYLYSFHRDIMQGDFSSLLPLLGKNDLILKPVVSDGGVGIFMIRKEEDHFILQDKKMSWSDLVDSLKEFNNYLIQERFRQKGFSNDIYSGSLNTMRIATMIDPETHKAFISYAAHRFGSEESGFLDNINQGGLASLIDLENGTLGEGIKFSLIGEKFTYMSHTGSSCKIINKQIPEWISVKKRLTEMAERMPYLKYVGWDIILSDDELFVLEGNVSPGLGLIQAFRPMTDYPAAWKFFKYYKYVT